MEQTVIDESQFGLLIKQIARQNALLVVIAHQLGVSAVGIRQAIDESDILVEGEKP